MPEKTPHPSPEELSAFSLGQLSPGEAARVEHHISECEPCCETMLGLSADDTFVGLLQEAKQSEAEQTVDQDGLMVERSSSWHEVPAALADHPRYELVGLIGKGGMGDVYKARHRMMERTVALKIINRELVRKSEAVDRFHREVKAAAQLSHPNIVTAYDAEQAGDVHFLVMEHVDGVDLSHTVKDRGALPIAEACDYVRQAAIGLQHAHEQGMVHRDIKPHNLMVTADGTVKILDFGLASLAPEALSDADTVEARGDLTVAGSVMGTPDFISPEQADDARQADIRSDIYSLGATLYFLLSARPPFADGSIMHKLKSHAQADPEPLESVRADVSADLATVISRMMAKDPDERFPTPAEVAEALAPFVITVSNYPVAVEEGPSSSAADPGSRTGFRRRITLGLIVCLLVGVPGLLLYLKDARDRKIRAAYTQLSQYLKTGESDEMSLNSLDVLLADSEGHEYLRKLDRDSERIAFAEGGLPRGLKVAAALLHDDRMIPRQRELSIRTQREGFSGGSTSGLPRQFRVDSVKFHSGGVYERKVTIRYSASTEKQHRKDIEESFQLNPGAEYAVTVALADAIEDRVDWMDVWKDGKPTGVTSNRVRTSYGDLKPDPAIAVAEIRTIIFSLDTHKLLKGEYPTMEEGLLSVLRDTQSGESYESLLIDPWGNPYAYAFPGRHSDKPDVWSAGPDGKTNTADDICSWKLPPMGKSRLADRDAIQGIWQVIFAEDSGRTGPLEALRDLRIVITKDTLTMEIAGRKNESTYQLNPSTNPKSIDLTADGRTKPGIYDLQGDTLRLCMSEDTGERPTAFDSQPDSVNDLILTMKRMTPQEISGDDSSEPGHDGPLTPELARSLIPKAASISNEDFQNLQTAPSIETIANKSLSLILMSLDISDDLPHLGNDFKFLVNGVPKPSDLAAAMSLSKSRGYVSMIQPEYITDCRIWSSTDKRARGFVAFNAPLLYIGDAVFEAAKHEGEWRIEKFRLQSRSISVVLGEDGKWEREVRKPLFGTALAFEILSEVASGIAFSVDSSRLAETNQRGVRIWSMEGRLLREFATNGAMHAPAFSPNGSWVFAAEAKPVEDQPGASRSVIRGWNMSTGEETTLGELNGIVRDLQVSPDGRRVAAASYDEARTDTATIEGRKPRNWGYVSIWDVENAERLANVDFKQMELQMHGWEQSDEFYEHCGLSIPTHLRFSHDGTRLATSFRPGPVVILDGHTGEFEVNRLGAGGVVEFDEDGNIIGANYTTKGKLLLESRAAMRWRAKAGNFALSMDSGGTIQLHDLQSPRHHQRLPQPDTPTPLLAISSNGRYVAVGETAGVTVWEILDKGQRSLNGAAAAQLRNLENVLKVYQLDNGTYPSTEEGLNALIRKPADQKQAENWNGPYLKSLPRDPWNNPYFYEFPGTRGGDSGKPDVWSRGLDVKDNTEDDIGNWDSAAHPESNGTGDREQSLDGQRTPELLDATYISNDTVGLLVAHPQRILSRKSKVKEELDQMFAQVAESEGLEIRNLRQIVVQLGTPPLSRRPIDNFFDKEVGTLILRFDEPVGVESYVDKHAQGYTKAEHKRKTYYKHDSRMEMWFPDNRTLIRAAERRILSFIDDPEGKGPMASRMGRADATDDLLLEIDVRQAGPLLLESLPSEVQDPEIYPVIEETIQKLKRIALTAQQSSDTPILARFQAIDAETARELHDQGSVLLETAKRGWPKLRDLIRERPADENTKLANALADEIDSVLPAIRLTVDEDQLLVRLEKQGGVDLAALLVFFLLID